MHCLIIDWLRTASDTLLTTAAFLWHRVCCYAILHRTNIQCVHGKWKKRPERRKHCALAAEPKFFAACAADRLPCGAGRPKFNQLEMVTYLYLQTQFGEDQWTQFWVIVVTDPQTNKHTHKHTDTQTRRQDRLQYTALQLASVHRARAVW